MILNFGKFKGKTVEYVFAHQPSYLAWAVGERLVTLDKKMEGKLMKFIESENLDKLEYESIMESTHGDWGCRDDDWPEDFDNHG